MPGGRPTGTGGAGTTGGSTPGTRSSPGATPGSTRPASTGTPPPGTPVRVNGRHVPGILLIDETLDAATPFEGSLEVRRRYPKSSLIAEPGGTSHANSLSGNACVDDQIAAYLADGTLPPRKPGNRADALCAPLPQPVPNAEAASSTASANSRVATRLRRQLASRSFR